jgi:omega-3 fatty acid desaturase (delta-15 desaturase)
MKNNSIFACALSTTLLWGAAESFAPVYHSTKQATVAPLRSSVLADDIIKRTPSDEPLSTIIDMNDKDIASMMRNDIPPLPGTIMKMLPRDTFQVDTATSLMYAGLDVTAVVCSMSFLYAVVRSDFYNGLPWIEQALTVAPLQLLTGFAMWCTWCIGHDAGHGTISKSTKFGKGINRIVGEITHSVICLTPFVPWALSHKKHHLNHNHLEKDYSHQWYIREEAGDLHPLIKASYYIRMVFFPFLYFIYLFTGIPDGGHVLFYGRMWDGESMKTKLDGALSVAVSTFTAGSLWYAMGTSDFAVVCMAPWTVMGFWLFMVTYLQHHSEDGKLYTDDTFTFQRGAFETVDRDYGQLVNKLSHHMMDGHVVSKSLFVKNI